MHAADLLWMMMHDVHTNPFLTARRDNERSWSWWCTIRADMYTTSSDSRLLFDRPVYVCLPCQLSILV